MDYLEACSFCDTLKQSIRDRIIHEKNVNKEYSVALVEEIYDLEGNFKCQLRFGGHDLKYCPQCGKKLNIWLMSKKIEDNIKLFRYKE